jgi:heat shock protein HslJ
MTFRGCRQILLQAQFSENQVFSSPSTYQSTPIDGQTCPTNDILTDIYNSMSRVFYFQININQLSLNDPYGSPVLKFTRAVNAPSKPSLAGVYTMSQYGGVQTSISAEITPEEMRFCQGMAVYGYSFPTGKNTIQLKKINNSCPSKELVSAIESVKYYRMADGIIDLYDKNVVLAIEMVFSKKYDPKDSIFASAAPASPTPTTSNAPQPKDDLTGIWSIITLFDIPFDKTPYSLNITPTDIILQGGCNTYTYPYTLTPQVQVISLGSSSATKKACQNSDDQLYVSGIDKMYKYLLSDTARGKFLNFYDEKGNIGYALQIKKAGTSAGSVSPVIVAPQSDLAFADGSVLMLLLKRRDLPRAIVTIKGDKLTYSRCNTITHTFKISDPKAKEGTIIITGSTTTKKACPNDNDSLYISTLNSAVKYSYNADSKTILFKDANGTDVVTFNRS